MTEVERFVCRIVEVHGVKGYSLINTEYPHSNYPVIPIKEGSSDIWSDVAIVQGKQP